MNCAFCVNGIVGIGADAKPCKYCMTPKRFISSLDKAIRKAVLDEKKKKEAGLKAVRQNLPDYPVFANGLLELTLVHGHPWLLLFGRLLSMSFVNGLPMTLTLLLSMIK